MWGIPEVLWIDWCWDESDGSTPKHDQEVDVYLRLKREQWHDDDILRKEDVYELYTAKTEVGKNKR